MTSLADQIRAKIARVEERVTEQVFDAALETELVGIGAMRDRIEAAETDWGRARQAGKHGPARPSAGRIETGDMHNKVTGETNRVSDTRIIVQWGWQDPEDYFFIQEHGLGGKIAPMEALHYSLHIADDELTARVKGIG